MFKVGHIVSSLSEPKWGKYEVTSLGKDGFNCTNIHTGNQGWLSFEMVARYKWKMHEEYVVDKVMKKYYEAL